MGVRTRNWLFAVGAGVLLVILVTVMSAVAATNTVDSSRADLNQDNITPNELKPVECSGIAITNLVDIGAGDSSTGGNDLILGTAGNDPVIDGGGGDDCILGGAGNDRRVIIIFQIPGLIGGDGDDVLIGGPGLDVCYGGDGNDVYYECEVEW